jgi:geranylgeranyl diphosphate synthase, type I
MPLSSYALKKKPAIESEMRRIVNLVRNPAALGPSASSQPETWEFLHYMLAYHMGWVDADPEASGKYIRPILLLLVTEAAGGNWEHALPAAAAVELLHNFSLIHDDIEDNSPLRRGRPTLWKNWGVPQAVNTGDVLFTLAHIALLRLSENSTPQTVLEATRTLLVTCLALTQGQYLDISYEDKRTLPLEAYWPMIQGKTASLISACTTLGALIAEAPFSRLEFFRKFGLDLGLAFQVQDDILGIWGDDSQTGKSSASDLLSGKKSLPVLFGLSQNGPFARRWLQGPILINEVDEMANQLRAEGAYDYVTEISQNLTDSALQALTAAEPVGEAGESLRSLANMLLTRRV